MLSGMAIVASVLCVGALAAQGPAPAGERPPWLWHAVDGADGTVLALRWAGGLDGDAPGECGAAAAVAEYRLLRARANAPAGIASGVRVVDDAAVAWVLVPARRAADAVAFCRALLDDGAPVDEDLAALAIARAALAADDADWLYPGTILAGRARCALLVGAGAHGVAGSAAAIQALTKERLRERLAAPVSVAGLGLGAVPDELRQLAAELRLRQAPAAPPPPRDFVAALPSGIAVATHPRADGPTAAMAFAVRSDVDPLALAVGVEVARMRAALALPLRGPEARARAPLVSWSWPAGDPVLLLCRRGRDRDEPDLAFSELDAFVADLRTRPPTAAEFDTALRTVRWELGLLPLPPGADAAALPGRAVALLLAELRGVGEQGLAAVTGAGAQAALAAVVDPAAAWRGALVPSAPRPSR